MTSGWFSIFISFIGVLLVGYFFSMDQNLDEEFFRWIVSWTSIIFLFLGCAFFKKIIVEISTDNIQERYITLKKLGLISKKIHIPINSIDHVLLDIKCVNWVEKTRATGTVKYDFFKLSIVLNDETIHKILSMNSLSMKSGPMKPNTIKEVEIFIKKFTNLPILGEITYY